MTRLTRKLTGRYCVDGRKAVVDEIGAEADIMYCIYDEDLEELASTVLIGFPKGTIDDDAVITATEIQPDLVAELETIEDGDRFFYIETDKLTLANFGPLQSKEFK